MAKCKALTGSAAKGLICTYVEMKRNNQEWNGLSLVTTWCRGRFDNTLLTTKDSARGRYRRN